MHWINDKTIKRPFDFKTGKNFQCGSFTIIEDGVIIGDNVKIGSFCLIKSGTVIEDNVFIDSFCISSGDNLIGEGSTIRYQSIIARNVIIGKNCYFCAGVKTAYLDHTLNSKDFLKIGECVFIGDNSTILAGVDIVKDVVIGAHSLVTKDLNICGSIYTGTPAKLKRSFAPDEYSKYVKIMEKKGD